MNSHETKISHIAIVGGGAAGYFAAITAAEEFSARGETVDITIYEAKEPLDKVRLSGGGRCNLTRACFDIRELVRGYPRGGRELLGAFSRWQPRDTIEWFESRGVALHTEKDLRVFPAANTSAAVTDCLETSARRAGVKIKTRCMVEHFTKSAEHFTLTLSTGEIVKCRKLIITVGGAGKFSLPLLSMIENVGHKIEPLVPSLFAFNLGRNELTNLAGLSIENVRVSIPQAAPKHHETGDILITHWGLSGPAILKISAWCARELHALDYKFSLSVNWSGHMTLDQVRDELCALREKFSKRHVSSTPHPFGLPTRLWKYLVHSAGIADETTWSNLPKNQLLALSQNLTACNLSVLGKLKNSSEFVTCGGVSLREVDFKNMQSRICPRLYFAGEILDIDGLTGGYNLQAAWTTGRLAGLEVARE